MKPIALSLLLLGACNSVASEALVPEELHVARTQPGSVLVHAEGSSGGFVGPARISSGNLRQALEQCIEAGEVFESLVHAPPSDWRLQVAVAEVREPDASLEMEVVTTLLWRLVAEDGRLVGQRQIATDFTATPDHESQVEKRGRYALEESMRRNLSEGMRWLGNLDLPVPTP